MTRRTFRDVEVATIVAERAAVLAFARVKAAQIGVLADVGKLPGVDAAALKQQLRGFADAIAIGLHRDGDELAEVRAALRGVMTGETA